MAERRKPFDWRSSETAARLSKHFQSFIVPLVLNLRRDNKAYELIFTGFLYEHRGFPFWVTAGHVVDELKNIKSGKDGFVVSSVEFWDHQESQFPVKEIPTDVSRLDSAIKFDQFGLDVALWPIPNLEYSQLKANKKNMFLTEWGFHGIRRARPEGFYLVGVPSERHKITEIPLTNAIQRTVHAPILCLPVKKIRRNPKSPPAEFWQWKDAFYGKIVAFSDGFEQPNDIKFMSGGPIVSIQQTPEGRLLYFLFAIQSVWREHARIIRATRMTDVGKIIDEILRQCGVNN